MLRMICNDVRVEPVLQEVTGETLNYDADKASDARLAIHARGFWERQYAERVMEIEQGTFTPLAFRPQVEWRMSVLSIKAEFNP